jgi:hypothetical protein
VCLQARTGFRNLVDRAEGIPTVPEAPEPYSTNQSRKPCRRGRTENSKKITRVSCMLPRRREQTTFHMKTLAPETVQEELDRVVPIDELEVSARRFPYLQLSPRDFELLVHELYHNRMPDEGYYDLVALGPQGKDSGRDILLRRQEAPVEVVQCKRFSTSLDAPRALREIVKFLTLAFDDPEFEGRLDGFRYTLALAADPSSTTLALFDAPNTWLARNRKLVQRSVDAACRAKFRGEEAKADSAATMILDALGTLRFELLRPHNLDRWLDKAPEKLRQRFFRARLVLLSGQSRCSEAGEGGLFVTQLDFAPTAAERAAVAEKLARSVAERLQHAGIYKRSRTIQRYGLESQIERFLKGSARIFPIIGMSGVGKSSAMAEFAEREDPGLPPRILVRGAEINPGHKGLRELVEQLPWELTNWRLPPKAAAERLLGGDGPQFVIVLDGLNEATASPEQIRNSWLPNSLQWLGDMGARLIFTSRPERWQSLALSIPHKLLHLPRAEEANPKQARFPPPAGPEPFRIGDFHRWEAEAALKAYGFAGRLSPDQALHPFFLYIVDALGADAQIADLSLVEVLDTLVGTKLARALERIGHPIWEDKVFSILIEVASDMMKRRSEAIGRDSLEKRFEGRSAALEALTEEHLLSTSGEAFRFQHDQVREHLQSRPITLREVASYIPRLPKRPNIGSMTGYGIYLFRRRQALRRSRFGELPPSVAALVLAREIGTSSENALEIPMLLLETARTEEGTDLRTWARQFIVSLLSFAPAASLFLPPFRIWFERVIEPEKYPDHRGWAGDVVREAVGLIMRSSADIDAKLALLPAIILREDSFHWRAGSLASDGFWDRYWENEERRSDRNGQEETIVYRLVMYLLSLDPAKTIAALGNCLQDVRRLHQPQSVGRQREPLTIGSVAKVALFRLRKQWPDAVAAAALTCSAPESIDLVDGLAAGDPEPLASAALERLTLSDTDLSDHLHHALWRAAKSSYLRSFETLKYAIAALTPPRPTGMELIWASRILLARFQYHKTRCRADPPLEYDCELVELLKPLARDATMFVRAHLTVNDKPDLLPEDYRELLEEDFSEGIGMLKDQVESSEGLLKAAIEGICSFITRNRANEPGRIEAYSRLVELLRRHVELKGRSAPIEVGPYAVDVTWSAGLNPKYYFSTSQVVQMGLIGLAEAALRLGGDGAMKDSDIFHWPRAPQVRKRLIIALASAPLSAERFRRLIYSLSSGRPAAGRATLPYLLLFRTEGREEDWDGSVQKSFYHMPAYRMEKAEAALVPQILAYWRQLPDERRTDASRTVLRRLDSGISFPDAAKYFGSEPEAPLEQPV